MSHRLYYRPIAVAIALLIPLAVLMGTYGWFQRPAEVDGKAQSMERSLKKGGKPDIVVLGSSLARTNVRTELLADELGVPRRNVVLLTLPNATAAHWYAIMKNRVFANGYRPRAVIMVGALTTMLTPDVLMESNVERLVNQLSDNEPVIGRKVFGTDEPGDFHYLYMREQAGQLRDMILETFRDHALGLFLRGKTGSEVGMRLAERANEVVFADENMDYELHRAAGTGLYVGAVEEIDLTGIDIAEDSLVPDIAGLAAEYGAKAVFVRTPFPPSNNDNDYVPSEYEEQAVKVISESGGMYIDLRALGLDDTYFRDMRHMSREGAAIFTKAMATTMKDMGVFRRKGATAVTLSVEPESITRTAPPADLTTTIGHTERVGACGWLIHIDGLHPIRESALAKAGHPTVTPLRVLEDGEPLPFVTEVDPDSCEPGVQHRDDGVMVVTDKGVTPDRLTLSLTDELSFHGPGEPLPSWWVYPGTTLTFHFEEPWPHNADNFDVFLLGHWFGGDFHDVRVAVNGEAVGVSGAGMRVWAEGTPRAPTDRPWDVEVSVPEDGPWLLIQNIRVGKAPFSSHLVGLPELLAGASIRIVGGKVEDTLVDPEFASEPPALNYGGKIRNAPRGVGLFAIPRYKALADAPNSRSSNPHKCSPIDVLEDGVPAGDPHVTCLEMANLKGGRSCHSGNVVYFTATDGTDPQGNGHEYSLALDPSRVCDRRNQKETTPLRGSVWLYPGDHLTLRFPDDRLDTFYDGANRLEYALDPLLFTEGEAVKVRLMQGDDVLYEERVVATGKRREYRRRYFEPPLPARAKDVRLEVSNDNPESFWLLVMAALSEDYEYGVAGAEPEGLDLEGGDPNDTDAAEDTDAPGDGEPADDVEGPDPFAEAADAPPPVPQMGAREVSRAGRLGPVPELPELKDVRAVRGDVVEGHLFQTWPVSNSVLAKQNLGWWSPVRLRRGETVLAMAPTRAAFRDGCTDCFTHYGQSLVARTSATGPLVAWLPREVPIEAPSGEDLYWIFPGSGLRFEVAAPWAGDHVEVRARIERFATDKGESAPPPRLRVGEVEVPFEPVEDGWRAVVQVDGTVDGVWNIDLRSPPTGTYALVLGVDMRDADGQWTVVARPKVSAAEASDEGEAGDAEE
ncbi:MAG: hypothetical protein H6733_02475 [Alphaproteobacteria bacterium]|nr:hypothetical protein [Alphaproteobacteria bacterium]